jgi:hypothetical protein
MTADDIDPIARSARQADRDEIEEGCGQSIASALTLGLRSSVAAHVIAWGDTPLAAFGDVCYSPGAGIGIPWLISTDAIEQHPRAFLRICKPLVAQMLERHQTLINYVDTRNTAAIRWLEWLGFSMGSAEPYGPAGLLFRRFSMDRGHG